MIPNLLLSIQDVILSTQIFRKTNKYFLCEEFERDQRSLLKVTYSKTDDYLFIGQQMVENSDLR